MRIELELVKISNLNIVAVTSIREFNMNRFNNYN